MTRTVTRRARPRTLLGVGVLLTALLSTMAASPSPAAPPPAATAQTAAATPTSTSPPTSTDPSPGDATPAPAATGTPIAEGTGLYPRAIRLAHNGAANGRILASTVTFDGNTGLGAIHESIDDGRSFRQVGTVADPDSAGGQGLCCATLYELPQQVGELPAGTLLWASSAGQDEADRRMALRVWASDDLGRSWRHLSDVAVAGDTGGLWEPEFSVAADGALVCHYADETDPAHSQKLVAARSYDGVTWGDHQNTVASSWEPDRPGMPVVRKLPDGSYFMIFEICNPGGQYQCVVHYRTSPDGWDWGAATHLGFRPETADGTYLRAAPTVAWSPAPDGDPDGRLVIVGQMALNADGSTSPDNGRIVLVNDAGGEGPWRAAPAPVQVPTAEPNYCPNYSSPLLPSADGRELFQIATDWDGDICRAYHATGPL
ncbi:exo-alpha-sialidase [Streptomyces sp. DSM 44915]|uniref:Exo-alpha-sialidase n=1 Tax=Streptomyces chisholmiae TaxID=3075540 RepID=A0ABU2JXI0_9ACTN|nr:exo-alpha-sialidase [Streptomyces sp. DSM 44915]MDT0269657.1 exo-alpha-sialidase [Streptomyces sp. DSM 44915]